MSERRLASADGAEEPHKQHKFPLPLVMSGVEGVGVELNHVVLPVLQRLLKICMLTSQHSEQTPFAEARASTRMYGEKKTKQKQTKRTSFNMLLNMVATVLATATCCAHTLTEPNTLSLLLSPTRGMKLRYRFLCLSTFTSVRVSMYIHMYMCMCVCVRKPQQCEERAKSKYAHLCLSTVWTLLTRFVVAQTLLLFLLLSIKCKPKWQPHSVPYSFTKGKRTALLHASERLLCTFFLCCYYYYHQCSSCAANGNTNCSYLSLIMATQRCPGTEWNNNSVDSSGRRRT